jgi:hypothetical protein
MTHGAGTNGQIETIKAHLDNGIGNLLGRLQPQKVARIGVHQQLFHRSGRRGSGSGRILREGRFDNGAGRNSRRAQPEKFSSIHGYDLPFLKKRAFASCEKAAVQYPLFEKRFPA